MRHSGGLLQAAVPVILEIMKAMVLVRPGQPLEWRDCPDPEPGVEEVLVRVRACAVCRTDLHVRDGELPNPKLPLIPGHEVIGDIERCGPDVEHLKLGQRVGVPWLGSTCGTCPFCRSGRENLCERAQFTGYTRDGGFAERLIAKAKYCLPIPASYSDIEAAPLLCAGLIGYRSWRMAGEVESLGLYGFGAAGHIVIQLARHRGQRVFAFTRPGDKEAQEFARDLGAVWAGASNEAPPEKLGAAIVFAPIGALVVHALKALEAGGRVVCGGIHMSDIPSFPYELLWRERQICSAANLTRRDGEEFMALAPRIPIQTQTVPFPLPQAEEVLNRLRAGQIQGAAVLTIP